MFGNLKYRMFILILIISIILSGCNGTNQNTTLNNDRVKNDKKPISQTNCKSTTPKINPNVVNSNSNLISKENDRIKNDKKTISQTNGKSTTPKTNPNIVNSNSN